MADESAISKWARNQIAKGDTADAEMRLLYGEPDGYYSGEPTGPYGDIAEVDPYRVDPKRLEAFQSSRDSLLSEMRETPDEERHPVLTSVADFADVLKNIIARFGGGEAKSENTAKMDAIQRAKEEVDGG